MICYMNSTLSQYVTPGRESSGAFQDAFLGGGGWACKKSKKQGEQQRGGA
jgi:hypothetical protein